MKNLLTFDGIPIRGIDRECNDGDISFFESEKELFYVADMSDCYNVQAQYFDNDTGKWKDICFEKPFHSNSFRYPVEAKTEDGKIIARGYFTDH